MTQEAPPDDPVYLGAVELVERYRKGSLDPVAVVEAHLARIESVDPRLGCYITVTSDRAREQAQASKGRYRDGNPLSPVDGVPFAAKDIFATAGILTTHGSKLGASNVPSETATAVAKLEEAGALLLGKLNLLEFATGSGVDSGFGPTRNPWNLEYESGGSSSGSGAAPVAGLATAALGTDTGGSIRNPSGRCGIVGIKPTYGRVSRHGVTPLAWTLDHAGPMARTVRDVARFLGPMSGYDPKDPGSADRPVPDFEKAVVEDPSLRGKSFAVAPELMEPCEPEVLAAIDEAIRHLESEGARRSDASLPHAAAANIADELIIGTEAAVYHEQNMATPEKRALMDPAVRLYVTAGRTYLATDYVKAQRLRLLLQTELTAALEGADVLICPADPTLAAKLGEPARLLGREVRWFEYGTVNLGNLTGYPSLVLPCGFDSRGVPIGLQIYGRPFEEERVLAFAGGYEQSTEWHLKRPSL
jgi:aspartyl-tRNA(Asn)/glutamyl-tRNA(Gln) amidotransferase subunit A